MEIYRTAYPNELMHHGIEGQKWGKRNGPPYPLDYSDHSAAEKKFMSDSKHWAKMDTKNRRAISRSAEVAEKRLEKSTIRLLID